MTAIENAAGPVTGAGGAVTVTHGGASITSTPGPLNTSDTALGDGIPPPLAAANSMDVTVACSARSDGWTS
ncbi:MAG: hypothetical protein E6J90_04365 [Deltaproteobacteria bacterium]|nr:MAG: hypothetical protein E6J90_04365 [Deltaproteobacteria bacterium]